MVSCQITHGGELKKQGTRTLLPIYPAGNKPYGHTSAFYLYSQASGLSGCACLLFGTAEVTGLTLSNIGFQGCFGIYAYGMGWIIIAGGVNNNKLCFALVLPPKYKRQNTA